MRLTRCVWLKKEWTQRPLWSRKDGRRRFRCHFTQINYFVVHFTDTNNLNVHDIFLLVHLAWHLESLTPIWFAFWGAICLLFITRKKLKARASVFYLKPTSKGTIFISVIYHFHLPTRHMLSRYRQLFLNIVYPVAASILIHPSLQTLNIYYSTYLAQIMNLPCTLACTH